LILTKICQRFNATMSSRHAALMSFVKDTFLKWSRLSRICHFYRKIRVRESFSRCQFHQHFTCAFFVQNCFPQLFSSRVLTYSLSKASESVVLHLFSLMDFVSNNLPENTKYLSPKFLSFRLRRRFNPLKRVGRTNI